MLGLTGNPVRRGQHVCLSSNSACSKPTSRVVVRRPPSDKGHRASSTSHHAAYAGGHGAGPCASAAAAAAAPTATQDLLVQVQREEQAQRYGQHHHDAGGVQLHQMQLHQLQHHDQVLLQQQLEHLHQQHQQQRHQQLLPQQRQQQQQQQLQELPDQRQQQQRQQQQLQQQQNRQPREWLPPYGDNSAAPQQQQELQQDQAALQGAFSQQQLQHQWLEGPAVYAAGPHSPVQQAVAMHPGHTLSAAAEVGPLSSGNHQQDSSTLWQPPSHANSNSFLQGSAVQVAYQVVPAVAQSIAGHQSAHQATAASPTQSAGHSSRPWQQQPQQRHEGSSHQQRLESSSQQQPVPAASQQRHVLDRTHTGLPLLRLRKGAKPAQIAAVLVSCLLQEQQVVLSAAGADLALLALNSLERAVALLQQQQPAGVLLVAAPQFRTSKRPVGGGRCQLYDLVCSVQHSDAGAQQQDQQQLAHRQLGVQSLGRSEGQSSAPTAAAGHSPQQQHLPGPVQSQHAHQADTGGLTPDGWQSSACCSSTSSVPDSPQQLAELQWSSCLHTSLRQPQQQLAQPPQQQHSQHEGCSHPEVLAGVVQEASAASHWPLQQQQEVNGNGCHPQQQHAGLQQANKQQRQRHQGHSHTPAALRPPPPQHLQQQWVGAGVAALQQQQAVLGSQQHKQHPVQQATRSSPAGRQHSLRPQPQLQQHQPAAGVLPGAAVVTPLRVTGCSINFADVLEDALLSSTSGAVLLPVVHAKQAVRVLEAVSLVSTRWQQRQHRQAYMAGQAPLLQASTAGSSSSGGAGEMQLVVQPHRGRVSGQSGSVRGLHVFVYAAPLVQ